MRLDSTAFGADARGGVIRLSNNGNSGVCGPNNPNNDQGCVFGWQVAPTGSYPGGVGFELRGQTNSELAYGFLLENNTIMTTTECTGYNSAYPCGTAFADFAAGQYGLYIGAAQGSAAINVASGAGNVLLNGNNESLGGGTLLGGTSGGTGFALAPAPAGFSGSGAFFPKNTDVATYFGSAASQTLTAYANNGSGSATDIWDASIGGFQVNTGGIEIGTPSGGNKGTGTLNAATIYQNGAALGSAALVNTGSSGATIPLLNGTNTWSGTQTFADGGTWGSGGISGSAGSFTALSASSTVSGTGFSTYLASPPAIGGTAAAAGTFTTLQATTNISTTGITQPSLVNGTAGLYTSSTNGALLIGQGMTDDFQLLNKSGNYVFAVATGSTTMTANGVQNQDGAGWSLVNGPCTYSTTTVQFIPDQGASTTGVGCHGTSGDVSIVAGGSEEFWVNGSGVNINSLLTGPDGGTWGSGGINGSAIGQTSAEPGSFTTLSASGQFTSTVATGTAPFVVASSTNVANLNASTVGSYSVGTSGPYIPLMNGTNIWSAVQKFGSGDLATSGSGSGTLTIECVSTCGTHAATFPPNTGTVAETNFPQTWSNLQTFGSGDFLLDGSTSGTLIVNCAAACGAHTATFPANTGTIAETNNGQTWGALQQFTNTDLALLGPSTTYYTLLESGLSSLSTSNNTLTLPTTLSDTLAALGTAQIWSAAQTFNGTVTLPEATSCTTSNCTLGADLLANSKSISGANTISANNSSGYRLVNAAASATVPTLLPNQGSLTTGIGAHGSGDVSVIAGGTEMMYWTGSEWFAPGIATGSSAQTGYACYATSPSGPELLLESVSCNSSLEEFKNSSGDIDPDDAFADLMQIHPFWGTWNQKTHPDADTHEQPFFGAHQVSGIDPRLGVYGTDGALNSVRNLEPVLVAGFQHLQDEIEALKQQQGH